MSSAGSTRSTTSTVTHVRDSSCHPPQWEQRFQELLQWVARHGNTLVPKAQGALGRWVARQRELKRTNKLHPQREAALNSINFVWNTITAMWEERYKALVEWKMINGHCVVPIAEGELGTWVSKQRQQKKRNKLCKEKVDALNRIGFTWSTAEADWEEKYKRLKIFKEVHGHASVPFNAGDLGWWVNTQRQAKRKGKISATRQARLDQLGFIWQPQNSRQRQNTRGKSEKTRNEKFANLMTDFCSGTHNLRGSLNESSLLDRKSHNTAHPGNRRGSNHMTCHNIRGALLHSSLLGDGAPHDQHKDHQDRYGKLLPQQLTERCLTNHHILYHHAVNHQLQKALRNHNEGLKAHVLQSCQSTLPHLPSVSSHSTIPSCVTTANRESVFPQLPQQPYWQQNQSQAQENQELSCFQSILPNNSNNNNSEEYHSTQDANFAVLTHDQHHAQDLPHFQHSVPSLVMSSFEQTTLNQLAPSSASHYLQGQQQYSRHHQSPQMSVSSIDQDVQYLQRFLDGNHVFDGIP